MSEIGGRFQGFDENVATFIADDTVSAGKFVSMSDNFTVKAAAVGDEIFGFCIAVRDGYAAVQLSGYIEAPFVGRIIRGVRPLIIASSTEVCGGTSSSPLYKVIYVGDGVIGFIL